MLLSCSWNIYAYIYSHTEQKKVIYIEVGSSFCKIRILTTDNRIMCRTGMTELNKAGKILKIIFILFCILFLLVGVAIFAGGIYLAVTSDLYSVVAGSSYAAGAAIIIVCGIGTIAVSIVGLIGAIGQFRLLLLIFSGVVTVVIILELAAGIYGFVRRNELVGESEFIRQRFITSINNYRVPGSEGYSQAVNDAVDFIQRNLDCCGSRGRSDWDNTAFFNATNGTYPASCCASEVDCGPITGHNQDCINATQVWISENAYAIGGIGIAFGIVEIAGVLLAFLLCCCIHMTKKKSHDEPKKLEMESKS